MNFDQMVDAWKAQDEAPLYGVNQDLLGLVLRHEEADLRRQLRWEQWEVYSASTLLLVFSGICVWAFVYFEGPALGLTAAVVATAALLTGVAGLWLGRRRQAQRERRYGNSVCEEIRRNLSLVDYQLSRKGRMERALLAGLPIVLAAVLLNWLSAEINTDTNPWFIVFITLVLLAAWIARARKDRRKALANLLPRRQRLSELLDKLNAND